METQGPLISFDEAIRRLRVPIPVFEGLLYSGLLGDFYDDGLPAIGLEHLQKYGTQWRPELGVRHAPYHNLPFEPSNLIHEQPPNTYTQLQISYDDSREFSDKDITWLAQFYLKPNPYFYPDPTALALIGDIPLKLERAREVTGAQLPTYLYPDPTGSLAIVMVEGAAGTGQDAFETAYDVVIPILDELSLRYDVPLPVAHTITVGIPSGVVTVNVPKAPAIKTIGDAIPIEPRCTFPELSDAVALYREAISSNNPFHQFLTLWKVLREHHTYTRKMACGQKTGRH